MDSTATRPDTYEKVAAPAENLTGLDLSGLGADMTRSAPLKITHNAGVSGSGLVLPQFRENAVDIDCSQNVEIEGEFGTAGANGDQVITIKGGCRDIRISGKIRSLMGRQSSHVEVGNWMDQSYALTSGVNLHLENGLHGMPVNVVTGWVVPFSVHLYGDCKWLMLESLKLKAYVVAKFVIRFFLRIPKGVKGPSWF